MKKTYEKPLVYCENYKSGVIISNSREYAEKMTTKIAELRDRGEIPCNGLKKEVK